jgi:hypothetical protein
MLRKFCAALILRGKRVIERMLVATQIGAHLSCTVSFCAPLKDDHGEDA